MPESTIVVRARDDASGALDRINNSVQQLTTRITAGAGLVAAGFGAVKGFQQLSQWAEQTTDAYLKQAGATRGLADEHVEFAARLQDMLGIQDETINRAQRMASMMGVEDDQMQELTKTALGLAEVTQSDLQSSMQKTIRAIHGNADAFNRYIPQIREAGSEEEKLALIQQKASEGLQLRAERSDGLSSALGRREAAMADLSEAIGAMLAPSVHFQNTLTVLAKVATEVIENIAASFTGGGTMVADAVTFMRDMAIGAFTAIEFYVANFGRIFEMNMVATKLALTTISEEFKFHIGERVPKLLEWFADNWQRMWVDLMTNTPKIVAGGLELLQDLFSQFFDWLALGGQKGMESLQMTYIQGIVDIVKELEITTEALPDGLIRSFTDREKELAARYAKLGGELGTEFMGKLTERISAANEMMAGFKADFGGDLGLNIGGLDQAKAISEQQKNLQATQGRLLVRGPDVSPQKQIADNTKQMNQKLARLEPIQKALENLPDFGEGEDTLRVEYVTQ